MDEVTKLAENDAALAAEETTTDEAPVEETATDAAEMTQGEDAPASEEASETLPQTEEAPVAEQADDGSTPSAPSRDADGFSSSLPTLEDGSEPRKHVAGGIGYEIIYVVRSGDQKLVETTGQRVRDLIEQNEGAIDNVRASEVRRFAYPIKKQTEGVYVVVNARFKPEVTNEMDRFFKLEENVLRHMMLKEDN